MLLKGVTAGVFNIVRTFLALFSGRRSKMAPPRPQLPPHQTPPPPRRSGLRPCAVEAADTAAAAVTAAADMAEITSVATAPDTAPAAAAAVTEAAHPAGMAAIATEVSATSAAAAGAATARTAKPQGRKVMSSGFDMQAEIAKLAERIIEPMAAKLTAQELVLVTGRIRDAFEQLNVTPTAADGSFENVAVNIVKPVQSTLTEAERGRVVDRLSGAMAAFCQGLGQRAA